MSNIQIGCGPFPPSRTKYANQFGIVEVFQTYDEFINKSTLQKWVKGAPEGFKFIITAPVWLTADFLDIKAKSPVGAPLKEHGFFQPTEANMKVWEEFLVMVKALKPSHVLFKTPASFSPSEKNRTNFSNFMKQHVKGRAFTPVWEPRGIWSYEEALELAHSVGAVLANDPYTDERFPEPPASEAYYVLTAPQGRRDFNEDDLLDLYDFFDEHEHDVTVIIRGQDRQFNAGHLQRIVRQERGEEA